MNDETKKELITGLVRLATALGSLILINVLANTMEDPRTQKMRVAMWGMSTCRKTINKIEGVEEHFEQLYDSQRYPGY